MAVVLTIAGDTKAWRAGSLSISHTANGRATASMKILSTDGTYRPEMDSEVIITENGTRIFAGLTRTPTEKGITRNGARVGIETTISVVDFNAYAERRAVNGTMPAAALIVGLTHIKDYLAGFGVTLSGSQVVGPGIAELSHVYVKASEVLNELATLASGSGVAYAWEIDEFKVLKMMPAGGTPFSGTERQFLIQQMEFYRWVPEGDTRLLTFFYAASVTAYDVALATIDTDLDAIIAGLAGAEATAFADGYVFATDAGFVGTERQFLIQQAEYYRWLPEGDSRLLTFFSAGTLTDYDTAIGAIDTDLDNIIAAFATDEGDAFDDAYATAQTSSSSAPFNVTGNTPAQVVGDIEVTSSRDHYANVIIVLVPSVTQIGRVESFTGDGVTTAFPLNYQVDRHVGYVSHAGNNETLGAPGEGATWAYDPATNTLTRSSAPTAGAAISITFDGTLSTSAIASSPSEIAARGYHEKAIKIDSIPSAEAAQARANAELVIALAARQTVKYKTYSTGLRVGQAQTITVPRRDVDATGVITDITIRDVKDRLIREVTVTIDPTQTNLGKGWRDTYKKWSGDTAGGNSMTPATVPTTTTPAPAVGPGGPNTAVQFNRNNVFGGEAAFTYDEATDSVVCGEDCSITAGDPVSCQVFGSNNHIAELP